MSENNVKVGDLIRIVNAVKDELYENGDIFEVTVLAPYSGDVYGANPKYDGVLYIEKDEYVIHRKAGEESTCDNCGKQGVHTCRGAEYHAEKAQDAVNPQHYKKGRVEVIDVIEDAVQGADPFEAVCQANVLKYVLRYRHKNGAEDLRKAQWYLEKLVAHIDE